MQLADDEIDMTLATETATPNSAERLMADDRVWVGCRGGHVSILPDNIGLPRMQPFHVNLYQRTSQTNDIANELADHIREQFQRRFQAQASPMARKAS